jgi:hypothetical protein
VFVDVVINVKTVCIIGGLILCSPTPLKNLFSGDSSSVRLAIENSWQSKSPLNRVIYKELTVADNLTGNELFDNLAKVCYDALTQRELHSQFYQHTAIVEIPIAKTFPDLSVSATYRASTESIEATDVERLFTAALIESITEAPHETAAPSAGNANRAAVVTPSESPAQRNELLTALNLYFENVAARLSFYRNGTDKIKETVGDLEDST